jgi:hypothetical protein
MRVQASSGDTRRPADAATLPASTVAEKQNAKKFKKRARKKNGRGHARRQINPQPGRMMDGMQDAKQAQTPYLPRHYELPHPGNALV